MKPPSQTRRFYDRLAPYYHLIYADWAQAIKRQARALHGIIKKRWNGEIKQVRDVSCGIGTQAIGLAFLGYNVIASDLSPAQIKRARREAARYRASLRFFVADMTKKETYRNDTPYDLIIACDNAIPHILSKKRILDTFRRMYHTVRPGGGVLISARDYRDFRMNPKRIIPYTPRVVKGTRYFLFQSWECHKRTYDLSLFVVKCRSNGRCSTIVGKTTYYAISISHLVKLLKQAGFTQVQCIRGRYFQPVLVGKK